MRIEVGKKYINAVGDIVSIVKIAEDLKYDFSDHESCDYMDDGNYYFNGPKSKYDLICEVNDFILYRYEYKFITKYEFLFISI